MSNDGATGRAGLLHACGAHRLAARSARRGARGRGARARLPRSCRSASTSRTRRRSAARSPPSPSSLGIATAATNHNTRHPMVTATFATTMHRLSGGRFALGLGRGFDRMFKGMGLEPITSAQLEDAADILRRLWKGEMILGHDGPSGTYPYLHQDADFDEDIPLMLVALGEKTIELAGPLHGRGRAPHVLRRRGDDQLGRRRPTRCRAGRPRSRRAFGCGRCSPPSATTSTKRSA